MVMIRFITRFFLLLGLCLGLSTCKREEPCPPEEEEAAIQLRALVRSFGDRYKVTGYTINGVDRSSYLDTLHLRNKVIDFRDFDQPSERRNRKPTDPASECYRVISYFPTQKCDTVAILNRTNFTVVFTNIRTDLFSNVAKINLLWSLQEYINDRYVVRYALIPRKISAVTYPSFYADVSTSQNSIILSTNVDNVPYVLTLNPR